MERIYIRKVPKAYDANWDEISSVSSVIEFENSGRNLFFVFFVSEGKLYKSNFFSTFEQAEALREDILVHLKSSKFKWIEALELKEKDDLLATLVKELSSGKYEDIRRKAGPTPKDAVTFKTYSYFRESETSAYVNEYSWVFTNSEISF